ncbi:CgeB family protein [Basilea psittacipulmonis]|uniref:Spore coat protein n=1 Tax=Basilea psittacipulmonis DSM 24701 TaxID=1072685 RepID=A0A077DFX5_9BURK|nr:glycosyltransferase [Basilea psittacipulmonis]AIL32292.1 spore coat protein [Basilea psittacipulmonis DSM 24701]
MNIYLISDELTSCSLCLENNLTVKEFWFILQKKRPSMLFVESAWKGYKNRWKYKIASYPNHTNEKLIRLVEKSKDKGIPTVFWNKEDGVHFDRFIDSAKHFDHVFTVDENSISKYKAVMGENASINTLMFAVQPKIHSFSGFNFKYNSANFVGSYSRHIHDIRRKWQNSLFKNALESGLGLVVFDRNSNRKSQNYRYPNIDDIKIYPAISYYETSSIYKDYLVSLNVNTVIDSPTMFSRRLIEIMACGGIAVTTPSLSVNTLFNEYCHIVHSEEEMYDLFNRLKYGPTNSDLERARSAAEYVANNHTWRHRLKQIIDVVKLR